MKTLDMVKLGLGAVVVISVIYLAYESLDEHPQVVGVGAGAAAALFFANTAFIGRALAGGAA